MRPNESPFPFHWWGIELEIVGLRAERPNAGTYGCYDASRLPDLPFKLSGTFDWLASVPCAGARSEHRRGKSRQERGCTCGALFVRSIVGSNSSWPLRFVCGVARISTKDSISYRLLSGFISGSFAFSSERGVSRTVSRGLSRLSLLVYISHAARERPCGSFITVLLWFGSRAMGRGTTRPHPDKLQ